MKNISLNYQFSATLWRYEGPAGWHFLSLPKSLSNEIRKNLGGEEEGWGRLKCNATIGGSEWKTAIWFDSKAKTYLLPVKAAIRKIENLAAGEVVTTMLQI